MGFFSDLTFIEVRVVFLESGHFSVFNIPTYISDIAFTIDGVLIGTNSTVIGKEGNAYQTGDFYVYKWQGSETTSLEDSAPVVVAVLPDVR